MDHQQQLQPFHTFPLILTCHSFAFPLILLDSRCIITSVTSLLLSSLPSICATLAVDTSCLYQAVACVTVPQCLLLDMLPCQAWNCSLSSPTKKKLQGNACIIETDSLISCFFSLKHKAHIIGISNYKYTGIHTTERDYLSIFISTKDCTR